MKNNIENVEKKNRESFDQISKNQYNRAERMANIRDMAAMAEHNFHPLQIMTKIISPAYWKVIQKEIPKNTRTVLKK